MNYEKNLEVLKLHHPDTFDRINSIRITDDPDYEVVNTKSGYPTLKVNKNNKCFYLHSCYNPVKEAESFVQEHMKPDTDSYLIYGLAFAYHIQKFIEGRPDLRICILETNLPILLKALQNIDLHKILENPNVKLVFEDSVEKFAAQFKLVSEMGYGKLVIHSPSLNAMPEEFQKIKHIFEEFRIEEHSAKADYRLDFNFEKNIKNCNQNIDVLFSNFPGIPAVIVAAGPSLDKNKSLLQKVKNKAIIISVGTAVKPLLNCGVIPDFIIITDPQDVVYNQLDGLDINIPIIILSTCNWQVSEKYKGYKYIALQKGFPLAEKYAQEKSNQSVETGGSVATTALDIALQFGCDPIIFVGLDLAYTGGTSHVKGTRFFQEIKTNSNLRQVADIFGNTIYTAKNLHIYLKWIQNRIAAESKVTFIDATEGGARIEGTKIMPLRDVIDHVLKCNNNRFEEIFNTDK